MGKNFSAKLDELKKLYFNRGMDTGEQFSADVFAIAMKQCGISKSAILAVTQKAIEVANEYGDMFETQKKNTEADVLQEHFDSALREIFLEKYVPWKNRYPYIKQCKY